MLQNYKENLNSSDSNIIKNYTGVGKLTIHAVNPTKEELTKMIGEGASKFNTDYTITKDLNGKDVMPLNFWCSADGETIFLQTINLYNEDKIASTGSVRVINNKVQYTYSKSLDALSANENMNWFSQEGIRVAKVNEILYYKLLADMIKWNHKLDMTFYEFCEQNNLTFQEIYGGNFKGLKELISEVNADEESNYGAYVLFVVKENAETGKLRQSFITRPDYIFRSEYGVNTVQKLYKEAEQSGNKITNHYFTFKFQEFNREDCVGQAPTETASAVESWT